MVERQAREATEKFYQSTTQALHHQDRTTGRKENGAGAMIMMRRAVCMIVLLVSCVAFAHEMRPAYLQLHQTGPDTYDIFWKVPAAGDNMRLSLYVELPQSCIRQGTPRALFANGAYTEQWSVSCAGGLAGGTIRISGLPPRSPMCWCDWRGQTVRRRSPG